MKLILIFFVLFNYANSQQIVGIGMGPSYQYDIYYSFDSGITAYPERNNWHLAFSTDLSSGNIRINSGAPVSLYEVGQSFDSWSQIESLNQNAVQLRNSNTDWNIGAFVSNSSGSSDFGWGNYNESNGLIEGNKIYVIDSPVGQKKIRINSFFTGLFDFTISNLDGSSEETILLDVSQYQDKRFIYFSLENNQVIDREPPKEEWDLLFTRYEENLYPNQSDPFYYYVSGVKSNGNLTYQFDAPDDVDPILDISNFISDINTIGYDWKEYSGSFVIVPNRSYFIFNQNENILYKIIFESFSGQSTGNLEFSIEEIEYNFSYLDENIDDVMIYPNPNSGNFNISVNNEFFSAFIYDLNGQIVSAYECEGVCNIDLNNSKGIYILKIEANSINIIKKIIVD